MKRFLGLLILSSMGGVSAAAPPDPWARVPELPTACYSDGDSFLSAIDQSHDAMQQEVYKQQEVNTAIQEKLTQLEPMEKQSRMQSFLMDNPQDAMKYMQAIQSQGEANAGEQSAYNEGQQRLDEELKALVGKYDSALEAATGPLHAKLRSLPDGEAATQA